VSPASQRDASLVVKEILAKEVIVRKTFCNFGVVFCPRIARIARILCVFHKGFLRHQFMILSKILVGQS
jgi:hypothetical protein